MLDERHILQLVRRLTQRQEPTPLAWVAEQAGWSESHVHRVFRAVVGQTPKQYTLRLRLDAAAIELAAGDAPILEVALETGFASHAVFTRAFRRQFGCTPTNYRARARAASGVAPLARRTSRCVSLFHLPIHRASRSPSMSEMPISVTERAEQPVLFIRRRVPAAQLQPTMAQCLPAVFQHVQAQGLPMAGPPFTRYVAVSLGMVTVECGIPVATAAPAAGEILSGTLPGGRTAVAIHAGSYEDLPGSHAKVEQWLESEGLSQSSPAWESYLTDPADHPDPADWRTELCWPVS
ncbi:MAG: AraC family transcriptional regulator [Myxococcales bacterium]|nr:AraC family transcriptional regulator [Myxococcales bacterium]